MGQKITLVDDFDGETEAVGIFQFFLDGQEYEIDLGEENMTKYTDLFEQHRKVLLELAEHGRPVKRQAPLAAPRGRTKEQLDAIRAWARANGYDVKDVGRIPEKIIDAYETRPRLAEIVGSRSLAEIKGEVTKENTDDTDGK